jgi:hypothetical protein
MQTPTRRVAVFLVPGQARKQGRSQTPLLLGGAADRVLVAR